MSEVEQEKATETVVQTVEGEAEEVKVENVDETTTQVEAAENKQEEIVEVVNENNEEKNEDTPKIDEDNSETLSAEEGLPISTLPRASINLQRVASVEEISRAIAKAEANRPRRRRNESETMQQWKKEFDENLAAKDAKEAIDIEELKKQAALEREQWYQQWKEGINNRREQRLRDESEARDQVDDEDCWLKMSRIVKSLGTRRNSKDASRMKGFIGLIEKPPKRQERQRSSSKSN